MGTIVDPKRLLDTLRSQPRENEWLEFKVNDFEADRCAHYISALANSAMLQGKPHAYLVYGVEDETHRVVGTTIRLHAQRIGNEPFPSGSNLTFESRRGFLIAWAHASLADAHRNFYHRHAL